MANIKKRTGLTLADQLKKSVLQAAIQGQLTEQSADDGTAAELFMQIQAEKQRLIADKTIKKEKALPPIADDEMPFAIPENWLWVRLGDLTFNWGQKTPNSDFTYIDISSINNKIQKLGDEMQIIQSQNAPSRARKIVKKGDIIYSTVRPYLLNVAIIDREIEPEPIVSTGFAVLNTSNEITNQYLFRVLISPYFNNFANHNDNAKGVAYPAINDEKLKNALIPLPPLAEQQRIVAKLDELLPKIDALGESETELNALQHAFPKQMQASLLQAAIQGQLTEQSADDGTATELFMQIQTEKQRLIADKTIKKEKALPPIADDEMPFAIPENWLWVRLGDICTKITDGDHNPPKGELNETPYIMASSTNIGTEKIINLHKIRYLSKENFDKVHKRTQLQKNDVLLSSVGTIGSALVYNEDYHLTFQRSVTIISTPIHSHFLKYVLWSPYCQYIFASQSTGTAQKGFYINQVNNLIIPLPPLAEQQRIVAKLDELLPKVQALAELE
ncbi:MAG: restriction endonuclease subunit S [Acinetobacter sp.]|nr:restriction endonuclease subunit S [Acinetobacter sp.]